MNILPSGLQYRVMKEGSGPSPKETDSVTVHYQGKLIDGSEFDSSYRRGETATLNLVGAVRGWKEVLPLMKTGSKWQVFVPANLAYGKRQSARIPPNSTLIFEIELLSVTEGGPMEMEPKLGIEGQIQEEGGAALETPAEASRDGKLQRLSYEEEVGR